MHSKGSFCSLKVLEGHFHNSHPPTPPGDRTCSVPCMFWDGTKCPFNSEAHHSRERRDVWAAAGAPKEMLAGRRCWQGLLLRPRPFSTTPLPAKLTWSPVGEPRDFRNPRFRTAGHPSTQTLHQVTKSRVFPTQKN